MSTEDADDNSGDGEQHECPECGDTFGSEQGKKIHYGVTHEGSIRGVEVECVVCGETKRVRNDRADHDNLCSTECERIWRKNMNPEDHARWNGGKLDAVCDNCGEEVRVWPSHDRDYNHHFCSEDCKLAWMGEHMSGPTGPTSEQSAVQCGWCGAVVERCPSQLKRSERSFCDRSCLAEWRAEERAGESSPIWKGGLVDYGLGWNEQKREQVRERDSHECQMCGISQEASIEESGRGLDVHHIIPARQIDDPEVRNGMRNLVSLCCSCHGKAEHMSPLLPAETKPEHSE